MLRAAGKSCGKVVTRLQTTMAKPSHVRFNVGGKEFSTSRTTIKKFPNCLLSRMIDDPELDQTEALYVDGDPELFPFVLQYMRHGPPVALDPKISANRVIKEMVAYGLEVSRDNFEVERQTDHREAMFELARTLALGLVNKTVNESSDFKLGALLTESCRVHGGEITQHRQVCQASPSIFLGMVALELQRLQAGVRHVWITPHGMAEPDVYSVISRKIDPGTPINTHMLPSPSYPQPSTPTLPPPPPLHNAATHTHTHMPQPTAPSTLPSTAATSDNK
ncbi:unnamed protein product [Vitrella brassicaformis CCMP3155]|uniref:Potassium channel tetramerisation-type BTB domain-containing protein n=2 Tax=Vitrella brassicaformis TaxID=1169539 RepID=A0A0G4EB49_VITBC|nr:unnamed protein product [Vitrella brassicaformis CCMP3155]|eukprot:CEL92724.1 unnamed protein product [Vitrella brassicaformis CCMP3155]